MRRRELKNLAALILIQAAGAVLPILVFPYLFHIMTAEAFSQLVLSESISLIVVSIVLYSFEVTGVSRIIRLSMEKDPAGVSQHFSEVFWTRLALWAICILAISAAGIVVKPDLIWSILGWSLIPLGYIFQSSYFYQGTEDNVPHCVAVLISRAMAVCSVYAASLFWSSPAYLAASIGLCYLAGGLLSLAYLMATRKVRLSPPRPARSSMNSNWVGTFSLATFQ
ncbi:oligosaccharide flippase family protein [Pseudomonas sp. KNUC1026]|uniref:oligosaccharide flippase family protein n=1 Tax=Pseudomonas sp. KNUC1026 TaxID=2893890 RepID=UPI003FA711BB